jgi:hypothetical protein
MRQKTPLDWIAFVFLVIGAFAWVYFVTDVQHPRRAPGAYLGSAGRHRIRPDWTVWPVLDLAGFLEPGPNVSANEKGS